ncbi:hypothetical protein D9619_003319 [Psilocybe cf. subviscida]|uniref:Nucleolar 27S pre-rRNA processing Urb2/Npa2 C-terminal domain-containing protein n=1 Tax=Psilocybe cf. subviscida TaxID=2480587 RepID=A0A8H5AX72_9AGAR|nr:hypothetical protein D9619_003319 [Psilocybe cf. subviscida]
MSSDPLHSSQDFVRALKAAVDPPVSGGPPKIDIALKAWNDSSFYVPSKAEIIADWLLTKLLKEKGKESSANPIFDIRFWRLLSSVTERQASTAKGLNLRTNKSWLANLLHRIPLGPVVVAVLSSFDDIATIDGLHSTIASCLSGLWPLSVQRMNVELVQSSFGAFISCVFMEISNPEMVQLGKTISASYRDSLTNSTQKKKARRLYQLFLQSHLCDWLQRVSTAQTTPPSALEMLIVDAGVETLFNLDVLRQIHDSKSDMALLEHLQTLLASKQFLVLQSSPQLLAHYIRSIKKHRGALFGQGSQLGASLDEVHQFAMNFFISMANLIGDNDSDEETWRARVGLLEVIKSENIFNRKQGKGVIAFNNVLDAAVKALRDAWKEELLDRTMLIVQCMSIIAEVDYDIIQPFIHMIMPLLVQIPGRDGLQFALLDIMLDYHMKTRTMDALIRNYFAAISLPKSVPGDSRRTYEVCLSSPAMHTAYMQKIVRALQTFLTESQCLPVVDAVSTILKDAWQKVYTMLHQMHAADDNPKKKRRTSTAPVVDGEVNTQELAVIYSLTCLLASVVLSSLPMSSLTAPIQEEASLLLQNLRADFIQHAISKSLKLLKKSSGNTWTLEITLAANLRLLYALDVSRKLSLPVQFDAKMCSRMSQLVHEVILPELTVEMFRVLFYSISIGQKEQHEAVIDHALHYLEANLDRSDEIYWLGHNFELIEGEIGKAKGSLALLHMIIERWLPLIDHSGSQDQLNRLLRMVVAIKIPVAPSGANGIRAGGLLIQILRSAEFWELSSIRTVFLDLLDISTSALDSSQALKTAKVLEKVAVYQLLLFFPMEYLSWQLLNDLIKRALDADVTLSESSSSSRKEAVRQAIATLRSFLKRAYIYSGSVAQESNDELSKFLIHVLNKSASLDTTSNDRFTKATLDLVEIYFTKLLKVSKKNGPQPVLDVLATFNSNLFTNAPAASSWSFITLVNLLTKEFPADSLPPEINSALAELYRDMSLSLLPRITEITASENLERNIKANRDLASGWYSLICLQHWLGHEKSQGVPLAGQILTAKLVAAMTSGQITLAHQFGDLCTTSFAILVRELEMRPEAEHTAQLDLIVASYIALCKELDQHNHHALNLYLGKACRKFTPDDYGYMLSLLTDSLSDVAHLPPGQLLHLVHLFGLLLRDHPSHSLQHIQKTTTVAISIFTEQEIFVTGHIELRLEVLEVVAQHCSEQPAALRSLDIAAIWLLLSKYLAPSQEHDVDSTPPVLHKIVAILSAIIRLRRDLVTQGLPHLGIILRRLLFCMRGCRSQLGARQTDVVMHTQPRWLNSAHSMGAEEAKVLSRLLETLNTKTIVRAYTSSAAPETQKAESLAKPFSKHAAYVLKAYIESMNDPLCVMQLDVRKELQPGIFALCEMVSEHSRDSLMISALDAGGKALLKTLWKDYDKQRYVGKG